MLRVAADTYHTTPQVPYTVAPLFSGWSVSVSYRLILSPSARQHKNAFACPSHTDNLCLGGTGCGLMLPVLICNAIALLSIHIGNCLATRFSDTLSKSLGTTTIRSNGRLGSSKPQIKNCTAFAPNMITRGRGGYRATQTPSAPVARQSPQRQHRRGFSASSRIWHPKNRFRCGCSR